MASRARLAAQVDDELRTLLVCPAQLEQQQQRLLSGAGEQLLSRWKGVSEQQAGQHFELQQHLENPHLFGPKAPPVNQAHVIESQLHALLVSHADRSPGFGDLLPLSTPVTQAADDGSDSDEESTQPADRCSPLLRLLRRVALWWYYRVSFDPLEQLLALSSSYELLFQLMTPHQQLSCMADILLVLACPFLADHCGQLDTPLHTATLLSMLKMAQQLALAEAQLQEQHDLQDALAARARQPGVGDPERAWLKAQRAACQSHARQAAQRVLSPAGALVRAARFEVLAPDQAAAEAAERDATGAGLRLLQLLGGLTHAAQQQREGGFDMVATLRGYASLCASVAAKAAGAFLAQVAELPPQQFKQWWCVQQDLSLPECPSAAVALWLHGCCAALQLEEPFQPDSQQGDPLLQLLQWVLQAMAQPKQQQWHQQQRQQQEEEQQEEEEWHPQHPAEALRQVLDVLLSALQHRHALSMSEWKLAPDRRSGQHLLLHALHCHCMQLLAAARDHLPAAACAVGSCRRAPTCQQQPGREQPQQQQQQRQAWRQCVVQVQRIVLQVLRLSQDWQQDNGLGAYQDTFLEYQERRAPGLGLTQLLNHQRLRPWQAPDAVLQPQAAAELSLTMALTTAKVLGSQPEAAAAAARVAAKLADAAAAAAVSTTRGVLGTSGHSQPQLLQQLLRRGAAAAPEADSPAATLAAVERIRQELQVLAKLALNSMARYSWQQQASNDWAGLLEKYSCSEQQLRQAAAVLNLSFLLLGGVEGADSAAGTPAGAGQLVDAALGALMRRLLADCSCPRRLVDLLMAASAQVSSQQRMNEFAMRALRPGVASIAQQQQQQGWAGAAAAAWPQGTRELAAMAAEAAGLLEDGDVLRLKGGRGGSSAGTSEAEFFSDEEIQLSPSPASQASPRRPQLPPPQQQQQYADESGDADSGRDDASTATSDTATEVIVAVSAAGSRTWAHRHGSAGKAEQQEGGVSMPPPPPQLQQQEHRGVEQPCSWAAPAAGSSDGIEEEAHARAAPGFDVLGSAAGAGSSSSSSIGGMAQYSWQPTEQEEAGESLQGDLHQQLPLGLAGTSDAAAAANVAQAAGSSKQAEVRLAAAGAHRQDAGSRLDTQQQQRQVCQSAAASSGAKGAFSLRRGFLSPRSTAAAAAVTGPAIPAAHAGADATADTGSGSGDSSGSGGSESGSPCGSEAAATAAIFDQLPTAELGAMANTEGSSRPARLSQSALAESEVWHRLQRLQGAGELQHSASSSSDAASSSGSSIFRADTQIWRSSMTPGLFEAFARSYNDWMQLLEQGAPQLHQPPQPPQMPSAAEVQAFQPSQHRGYFAGAEEAAVRAWVCLLCTAAEANRAVRGHATRMLEALELLKCTPQLSRLLAELPLGEASGSATKVAMQEPEVLALLTLALQSDISDGFVEARDQHYAAVVTERLWAALDSAYSTVVSAASKVPAELQRLASVVDGDIISPLGEEQERSGLKGLSRPTRQQGFAGLVDAVAAWVQLVTQQLEQLGPVPMQGFAYGAVPDELVPSEESEVPQAVERLELWRQHFLLALDWVKKLVLIDTWLAHAGHALQVIHKLLRRTQRVLVWQHGDAVLAAVQRHFVQRALQQLSDALVAACAAHKQLREAFEQRITRDSWGVIQRAFRLMCKLCRAMDQDLQYKTPHSLFALALVQHVLGPITRYLPSASPYIPNTRLTANQAALLPNAWSDHMWQQMFFLLARLQHPCASFWWMIMPAAANDTKAQVERRADGSLLVLQPNSDSSSGGGSGSGSSGGTPTAAPAKRPAGRRKGSAAAAQQPQPQPQARPLPTDKPNGGCSSSGGSKGQAVQPRGSLEQGHTAVFADARGRDSSSLVLTYDSSDDDAADCHAVLLQQRLQRWQQVFEDEQQQEGEVAEEGWQWLQTCKGDLVARMQTPTLPRNQVADSLSWGYMPPGSAASTTCSSSGSSDCSEGDSADLQHHRGGSSSGAELRTHAAQALRGLRSPGQQQERQQQRLLRRLRRSAVVYDWGGVRPWQVVRAALLARRQMMISRVVELQRYALTATTKAAQAAEAAGSSSSAGVRHALLRMLRPEEGAAAAGQADDSASSAVLCLQLRHKAAAAAAPAGGTLVPSAVSLLQHVGCTWQPHMDDRDGLLKRLVDAWEGLGDQQQRLAAVLDPKQDLHRLQAITLDVVWEQHLQHAAAGVTTRQLLYQVLSQLKPSACQWYEAAAHHHHLQQQQREGAAAAQGPVPPASVPECTSPGLWSTVTRSLASDLLLVPPSIRDMVANGWAAGAGRLPGANGGSSSASGIAARMLAVQYARAARRQYAKGFQTSSLVSQLLVLQLLAEDEHRLAELQPDAQQHLHAALAAHTTAAAAGMMPLSQVTGSLYGTSKGSSFCCCGAADMGGDSAGSSSSTATCSCAGPTLLQLAAQAGCFTGAPQHLLPWLQLVCRYHALSADVTQAAAATWAERFVKVFSEQEHCDTELASMQQPWRLMAAACALSSLGLPASPLLAQLAAIAGRGADPGHFNGRPKPLTVSPHTPAAAAPVSLKGPAAGPGLLQQQSMQASQQQQQQQQQEEEEGGRVQDAAEAIAYWLQAQRLTRVPPGAWQQHIEAHVLPSTCGDAGSSGSSSSSGLDPAHVQLLADVACDWCSKPLPEASAGSPPAAAFGCHSCGAAQYCSRACAEGAKRVHAANCWRLQALAANGLCWQQAAFQHSTSSSRSRSFWDLSAVEPRLH